jgi:putative OPT family oligopeptide transporter
VLAIGLLLVLLFSFFFTSVAANAIAVTANNPASGMTMLTVIISSIVLLSFGLTGTTGMFFVMAIAGMVCTALCVSGQFITDLKIGYWLGSTPSAQEKVKFLGVIVSAIAAALTIIMLAQTFQFGESALGDTRPVLASPQASILKALVVGFMSHQPVAYLLFGVGAMITLVMEMLGKSSLVFALGIYLPLGLTSPMLVGGCLSHFLNKKAEKAGGQQAKSIRERGIIIASGLVAGGALGGVLGASLRLFPGTKGIFPSLGGVLGAALRSLPAFSEDWIRTPFFTNDPISQSVAILLFAGICMYVWFNSSKKKV